MEVTVTFKDIKDEIIRQLKKANTEIKLAVAWLTDEDIIRVLCLLAESGIRVHVVICNSKENFINTAKFRDFLRYRGKLFVATNPFMHHKFCIIDDKTIINGSYNWSYPARRNEENILVLQLDMNVIEDAALLNKFSVKFTYLHNKCATAISDLQELNAFRQNPFEMALQLSGMEMVEIQLRQQFETDVLLSINKSRELRIPFDYTKLLERMKTDGGGVNFVKRLLYEEMQTGEMKSGFRKLEEQIPHRVDLSLEYLVSRPVYQPLFSPEEISFCINLMKKYKL